MSTGHGEKLSRKQELAVSAVLSSKTLSAAAELAGVSSRQLATWMKLPSFQAALRRARQRILESTVSRLLNASGAAVETLERNLTCGNFPSENAAAKTLLEMGVKGVELLDLAARIERLELAQDPDRASADEGPDSEDEDSADSEDEGKQ